MWRRVKKSAKKCRTLQKSRGAALFGVFLLRHKKGAAFFGTFFQPLKTPVFMRFFRGVFHFDTKTPYSNVR